MMSVKMDDLVVSAFEHAVEGKITEAVFNVTKLSEEYLQYEMVATMVGDDTFAASALALAMMLEKAGEAIDADEEIPLKAVKGLAN
jgi:hypothetical protein